MDASPKDTFLFVPHRIRWTLPGGAVRANESPRQCAHRELEEETSLVAASSADLWQFVGFNRRHHVFIVEIADSADPQPRNEMRSCRWFVPTRHRNTICKCADEANSGTGVGASWPSLAVDDSRTMESWITR
ncbi:NUDIX domain-containing protein [Paraburkholderia hospita]